MQECYSAPGISDHEIVLVTLEPEAFNNPSKSYKVYLWDSANLSELKKNMCNFTGEFCDQFCDETSVEILWTCLRDKLLFLLDKFVPSKLKNNNNNRQPWVNRHIKQLRRRKQASYNHARFTKSPIDLRHYNKLKKCKRNAEELLGNTCSIPYMTHIKMARKKDCFNM